MDGDWSHEIKRCLLLGTKVITNLYSILKSRDITLPTKVRSVKAIVFSVVMYGCGSWTIKKAEHWRIDAFELWCWKSLLRVPWTGRRFNQSNLKERIPEYSLEGLMQKLKLQYFAHLMWRIDSFEKTLMLGKIEGGRRRGWQDGWMASPIQWVWVWVNSGSWWWAGRPGGLPSMGSQSRTRLSDWTELISSILLRPLCCCFFTTFCFTNHLPFTILTSSSFISYSMFIIIITPLLLPFSLAPSPSTGFTWQHPDPILTFHSRPCLNKELEMQPQLCSLASLEILTINFKWALSPAATFPHMFPFPHLNTLISHFFFYRGLSACLQDILMRKQEQSSRKSSIIIPSTTPPTFPAEPTPTVEEACPLYRRESHPFLPSWKASLLKVFPLFPSASFFSFSPLDHFSHFYQPINTL